ncbi:MAG: N-acetylmuramoyl-L-alanine amidase [Firmicutes bacterium]|nr:N-acetylmuramoyl-L-alanine amidase [Bacillota bacterium]
MQGGSKQCKHTHIIVHHTGAEEKNAEQVKQYHLSLGWGDIGYNYVIERSGQVVEGRPLDLPGAHCRAGGMNHCSIGVSVIGNLEKHPLPQVQHEALWGLLQELAGRHRIPVENILGHREVPGAATACPGKFMDMNCCGASNKQQEQRIMPGSYIRRELMLLLSKSKDFTGYILMAYSFRFGY